MNEERALTMLLRAYTNRPKLIVEFRKGYGWFIVEKNQTLMGFHSKRLLKAYMENVKYRGLYTPTVSETFGS